jgi:hypothetical protein
MRVIKILLYIIIGICLVGFVGGCSDYGSDTATNGGTDQGSVDSGGTDNGSSGGTDNGSSGGTDNGSSGGTDNGSSGGTDNGSSGGTDNGSSGGNDSSGGGGGGGVTISTDKSANTNLLTSLTGQNSVTISGTWINETFGSTGQVTVNIAFDSNTNAATVLWNIDGNVYGGGDPDPETFVLDMTDFINNGTATLSATSTTYGDVTGTMTFYSDGTGTFEGFAENEPTGKVTNAKFSGSFEINAGAVTFILNKSSFDFLGTHVTMDSALSSTLN